MTLGSFYYFVHMLTDRTCFVVESLHEATQTNKHTKHMNLIKDVAKVRYRAHVAVKYQTSTLDKKLSPFYQLLYPSFN